MKIEVILTEKIFRKFTTFDILRRQKRWQSPAIFASILGFCAIICYIMHHVDGAVMLGTVLLVVGLGMPAVYFISFFTSLRPQVLAHGLARPKHVYTLELTDRSNGISISNEKEHADYKWKQVFHVYRDTLATYLYLAPTRAFILPNTCIEDTDALWALMCKMLPEDKRTDLTKRR